MGLVLVEGESQIANIMKANNVSMASPTGSMTTATATSTPNLVNGSTSASASLVVGQGLGGVVMLIAFSAVLALVMAEY